MLRGKHSFLDEVEALFMPHSESVISLYALNTDFLEETMPPQRRNASERMRGTQRGRHQATHGAAKRVREAALKGTQAAPATRNKINPFKWITLASHSHRDRPSITQKGAETQWFSSFSRFLGSIHKLQRR